MLLNNHGFKCKLCNEFVGEITESMTGTPVEMFISHIMKNHSPGDYLYIERL